MGEIISVIILIIIVFSVVFYLVKSKKKGKCVGCPHADTCKLKDSKNDCNANRK